MIRVLMIDDDAALTQIVQASLDKTKFECITASTGKLGFEIALKDKPDFILLDEIMPDLSGNEVLALLKTDETTKHIPVAIFSGFTNEEMVKDAKMRGAVDYLLKGEVTPQMLSAKIESLLTIH